MRASSVVIKVTLNTGKVKEYTTWMVSYKDVLSLQRAVNQINKDLRDEALDFNELYPTKVGFNCQIESFEGCKGCARSVSIGVYENFAGDINLVR